MTQPDNEAFPYRFERALVNLRTAVWRVEELMEDADDVAAMMQTPKGHALSEAVRQDAVFLNNVIEQLTQIDNRRHID